jgi:1-acyl-sn-glycerol-3-phosphate acyltransferase
MIKPAHKTNWVIGVSKIIFFLGLVVAFLAIGFVSHLTTKDVMRRRLKFTNTVHYFSKIILWLFNVKVKTINKPRNQAKNHLVIANHLGFLDDFIISASMPTMFVTSVELRKTPVVGLLSELAGCVYVESRNRANIANEMKDIESALKQGFDVTLYPEAKTTDGQMVHPFKKTLLMSCANTPADLLPTVINFKSVNGEAMTDRVRDLAFWYEKKPVLKVLWGLCAIRSCDVEFEFLHEIEVHSDSDHRQVAAEAQAQVDANYIQIPRAGIAAPATVTAMAKAASASLKAATSDMASDMTSDLTSDLQTSETREAQL